MEGLRWAFATHFDGEGDFDTWQMSRMSELAPRPPQFSLPGLQEEQVSLDPGRAVTLVNFWSPT